MLRLADDVVISIGPGQPVRLRASLRAAIRLERQHGFVPLLNGIAEGNLTIMRSIIVETAIDDPADLLQAIEFEPLGRVLPALQAPLMALVEALIGLDDDDIAGKPTKPTSTIKPFSWSDHFERLFGFGTAWLGWPPADTWSATPREIIFAYRAKIEMLKAIHGSADQADDQADDQAEPQEYFKSDLDPITGRDPAFDRVGLERLRAKLMSS